MDYLFASHHKGPRFRSPGGTYVKRDSSISVVFLHWWPRRDWSSLWPRLRQASSEAGLVPNGHYTWSHTAFLSRFHARCRSSFRLHNRRSQLLGGSTVQSLQSHFILTMSHWSSGRPVCFPSQGTQVQIRWGDLCETEILLLALSCYKTYRYSGHAALGIKLFSPRMVGINHLTLFG